jgi:2-polyprenyl-3-methyl-5-hydroxy-6-metoxy-1,4-benzoquinol methylase
MESAICQLCGSPESKAVRRGRDFLFEPDIEFTYVECANCRLVYLDPRPSQQEMAAYYPPEYYEVYRQVIELAPQSRLMRLGLRLIRGRRIPRCKPGRLLDIGCGSGLYLACLRNAGWRVEGVEISESSAVSARSLHSLDVHCGFAETVLPELPEASFDVITMWHVLEHLHEPRTVLGEIRRLLRPGGRLMIEVPNYGSVWSKIFQSAWAALEPPRHLFHFTSSTLRALLESVGFHVERVRGVPSPAELCASSRLASQQRRGIKSVSSSVYFSNPFSLAVAYPAEWLLARARLSGELSAVAVRRLL